MGHRRTHRETHLSALARRADLTPGFPGGLVCDARRGRLRSRGRDLAGLRCRRTRGAVLRLGIPLTTLVLGRVHVLTGGIVAMPRWVTAGRPGTGLGIRLEPLPRVF